MTSHLHPEQALDRLAKGKTLSRRQFIGLIGAVAAGEVAASQLGPIRRLLASGTAGGSADGVTVFLYLGGGNDGLNTVVPLVQSEYDQYVRIRTSTLNGSSIAYPAPGTPNRADSLLVGDSSIGFNPGMVNISQWYRNGKVAVIQGVGYSNANFSHFESQEHWWSGAGAAGSPVTYKAPSGWLGRFADASGLTSLGAISINSGGSLSPSLRSVTSDALAISPWQGNRLGDSTQKRDQRAAVAVRAMTQQSSLGALGNDWSRLGGQALDIAPAVTGAYTGISSGSSGLKRQLTMAANLIGANLGTRIIHTDTGGFDTHENQRKANTSGVEWHTGLWMDIDDSLNTFFSLLSPANRLRVNVVIYSEFGRRAEMNGTYGTDHGAASVAFVVGDNVTGGRYGEYPSLFDLRDPVSGGGGNLKSNVDFRRIYATLLQGWLGVDATTIIGAQHQSLGFIAAAPGDVPGATTTTTSSTSSSTSTSTSTSTSSSSTSTAPATTTTTIAATTTTIGSTASTVAPTTTANPTTTIVTTSVVPTTIAATTTTVPSATTTTTTATATTSPPVTTTVTQTTVPAPATTSTTATPATTTSTSSTTSTTTTMPTKLVTPGTPGTTPSPSSPDVPNVVSISIVAPAPPPAAASAELVFVDAASSTTTPATTNPPTTAPASRSAPTSTGAPVTTRPPATSTITPRPRVRGATKRASSAASTPSRLALVDPSPSSNSAAAKRVSTKLASKSSSGSSPGQKRRLKSKVATFRAKSSNR